MTNYVLTKFGIPMCNSFSIFQIYHTMSSTLRTNYATTHIFCCDTGFLGTGNLMVFADYIHCYQLPRYTKSTVNLLIH